MGKINVIFIALKCMSESQGVITFVWKSATTRLIFNTILIITNFGSDSMPTELFCLAQILTIREDTHSLII
jgi:hypothetical protein